MEIKSKDDSLLPTPKVGLIMGSQSDWPTMEKAYNILMEMEVATEVKIVSAHRTPDLLMNYAKSAKERGVQVIIAGAGGAAHLPGMVAANTTIPVLGVPILSKSLNGIDSLLSIVQMPKGIPVLTLAIGESGAINSALSAVAILALNEAHLHEKLLKFREHQTQMVLNHDDPRI